MKVKDVKKYLDDLQSLHDDAIKIQQYCKESGEVNDSIAEVEGRSKISTSLQVFALRTAKAVDEEIQRIKKVIDEAEVRIPYLESYRY